MLSINSHLGKAKQKHHTMLFYTREDTNQTLAMQQPWTGCGEMNVHIKKKQSIPEHSQQLLYWDSSGDLFLYAVAGCL